MYFELESNTRNLWNVSIIKSIVTSAKVMKSVALSLFVKACLVLAITFSYIGLGYSATIQNLEFSSLPGGKVEVIFNFDQQPPEPRGYTIEKPARIALDLLGVKSSLNKKTFNLGLGNARSITVLDVKDRTRVIVNLTSLTGYDTKIDGKNMIITIGRDSAVSAELETKREKSVGFAGITEAVETNTVSSATPQINNIDFRRGVEGDGQILIELSDPSVSVDLSEQGGKIIAEFIGVELPEALKRRLDVTDFASPVKTIDSMVVDGDAVIQISPGGEYEYLAYQADNLFTISVKPVSKEELERRKKENFIYTGEKLSLIFQNIEVRSVLQIIADFTGLNLVASDTVGGSITLRLKNVPWDQALDLILKTKGLDKRQVGNVMLVAPAEEIAAREKLELEATKQVEELAPLRSEFIQVNYAKASDLAELIAGDEGGLLSGRGSIVVDERTNTLLLRDTVNKIEEVRLALNRLDVPVQQVLIESRVVVANSDFNKEFGVRWGTTGYDINSTNTFVDANGNTFTQPTEFTTFSGGLEQTEETLATLSDPEENTLEIDVDPLIVDLGVTGRQATSLALGYFDSDTGFLELELSALESDGSADIIATPKVLTADQQTARISSGTEIPYQEASSSGATTVSFKEAVLSLEVTPQITPDGRIIMDLQVNQDTVGEIFNNVPSIDTNEILTSVLVEDGETVVLGGIFRREAVDSVVKTPFFGDLPIVGRLFKQTIKQDDKQELLVFITPKIVRDVLSQN